MIRASTTLLDALGSAVDAAHQDHRPAAATDVCPSCDGDGRIRHSLPRGPVPFAWTDCPACGGSGEVPADAVVHCAQPGCGAPCWVDRACTHGADSPLCSDHAPACVECTGVRGDR